MQASSAASRRAISASTVNHVVTLPLGCTTMSKHHMHVGAYDPSLSGCQTTLQHHQARPDAGCGNNAYACSEIQELPACTNTLQLASWSVGALTSAATGCQDVNTRSKNVHTCSCVVILIDQLIVAALWRIELIGHVTSCCCNGAVHIGWCNLAGIDLIIACCNNNGDAVLLYQVGDCRLKGL